MLEMSLKAETTDNPALYKKFKMGKEEKAHITNLLTRYQKYFFTLLNWWENNLERYYDDQTVYWFDTKEKFEPIQCEIVTNKLTAKGLALSAQYMTGQSASYPKWIAVGTGTSAVRADDKFLGNEITRTPADYYAASGNIISSGVLFSENIVDAIISEFGGFTSPLTTAFLVWKSVITDVSKRLDHDQGNDRPTTSHALYLTSR
jgi:hypothetical protein